MEEGTTIRDTNQTGALELRTNLSAKCVESLVIWLLIAGTDLIRNIPLPHHLYNKQPTTYVCYGCHSLHCL